MAKAIALVSAVCILALVSHPSNGFNITGSVYCDPCRVQIKNQFSYPLPGATVNISCFDRITDTITYTVETVTDKFGDYKHQLKGDHRNEYCEVKAIKSPKPECSVKMFYPEHLNFGHSEEDVVLEALGFMSKGVRRGCSIVEKME